MVDDGAFFSRQLGLRGLDLDRLRASSALVAGVGNVGQPAALELARAGVGRLVLIDCGNVEPENLSRGIITRADLGTPKAVAAARVIRDDVPGVDVSAVVADVRVEVPEPVFSSCDAVVIATDSWSSRWSVNRWAHALPGRVQVIVAVGLLELNWDVVSSLPGGPCVQCPHGNNVPEDDDSGDCGIIVSGGVPRIDPSVSFTGAAAAAYAVLEVCSALGGAEPRFAGRMLSFEYEESAHRLLRIVPAPDCEGHRRLALGRDYVVVEDEGVALGELEGRVAEALAADPADVSLAAQQEILRSRTCRGCGALEEIGQPLLLAKGRAGTPCVNCGGTVFEVDPRSALEGRDRTLAELGVANGKAVVAHVGDRRTLVIRR